MFFENLVVTILYYNRGILVDFFENLGGVSKLMVCRVREFVNPICFSLLLYSKNITFDTTFPHSMDIGEARHDVMPHHECEFKVVFAPFFECEKMIFVCRQGRQNDVHI